jgi:hypothetical protein
MGILFGFKAYDITTKVLETFTESTSEGNIVISTPLTVDPISDAVNNVRVAFNGFATDDTFCIARVRARSFFKFQIPEAGRITVHGHMTYGGVTTVTGRGPSWLLDWPGMATVALLGRMRVRVRDENDRIVFTRNSPERSLFGRLRRGTNGTRTSTDIVSAGLLEEFFTMSPPEIVQPSHRIYVRMQYIVQALASQGAEFVVDFDGSGLNVPMVIVNY